MQLTPPDWELPVNTASDHRLTADRGQFDCREHSTEVVFSLANRTAAWLTELAGSVSQQLPIRKRDCVWSRFCCVHQVLSHYS